MVTATMLRESFLLWLGVYTVEPLNKGHVGDNINSAVLSFIERLSSFRGSKFTREWNFWDFEQCPFKFVERFIILQCLYFGGSTVGDSTV